MIDLLTFGIKSTHGQVEPFGHSQVAFISLVTDDDGVWFVSHQLLSDALSVRGQTSDLLQLKVVDIHHGTYDRIGGPQISHCRKQLVVRYFTDDTQVGYQYIF